MKKISLLFTLALTSLCTTGCSLEDIFNPKQETPTDQKGDDKKEVKPESIVLRHSSTELYVGDSYEIETLVLPEGANQKVLFTSDDPTVASVEKHGIVTAESVGDCIITIESAEDSKIKSTFEVSVFDPVTNYNVVFDGNGNTGGSMANAKTQGSMYDVPTSKFTKTNYHFKNWDCNINGTWTQQIPGDTITGITGDITLKVNWEADITTNYNVTFDGNGNTGGSMSSATTNGSTYEVPTCGFTKENYVFKEWALGSSLSNTRYKAGATIFNISSDITLTAIWQEATSDPYYEGCEGLTGTALLNKLRNLNSTKRTSTIGYKTMGTTPDSPYKYTDYDPSTVKYDSQGRPYGTAIISFYSGKSVTSFNKEHVWPNTHGGNLVEADIHMPRPTVPSENGSRGHSFFIEGKITKNNTGWDPAMESFGEESYRGDSARIIFYCMIATNQLTLLDDGSRSSLTSNKEMGVISDMLSWNLRYPVLDRERRRNEGAQSLQGNRNPFIDHPEYACRIWKDYNSKTQTICAGY